MVLRSRMVSSELEERSWEWRAEWTPLRSHLCPRREWPEFVADAAVGRAEVATAWETLVSAKERLCHDGSGFPRGLSRILEGHGRALFVTTHGRWRDEEWGPPLAAGMVGPQGSHAEAVAEDRDDFLVLVAAMARVLGASPSMASHVVFEGHGAYRATDVQETPCADHVRAFLEAIADSSSSRSPTKDDLLSEGTIFASLATLVERTPPTDDAPLGEWVYRRAATAVRRRRTGDASSPREEEPTNGTLAVRLQMAPESKLRGRLVVHFANSHRRPATLRVPVPWYFEILQEDAVSLEGDKLATRKTAATDDTHGSLVLTTEARRGRVVLTYRARLLNDRQWPYDQFRGFDVPPAYADCGHHRAFSSPALVMLPEHDRSMIFNVITIYSTFFAFLFGSVMTTLVRKSPQKHQHPHSKEKKVL